MLAVIPLPFSPLTNSSKLFWVEITYQILSLHRWCISLQLLNSEKVTGSPS